MKGHFGLWALLVAIAAIAMAADSSSGEFSATSPIYANWSNSYAPVITLANNTPNYAVDVLNATSGVKNSTFSSVPFLVLPNNTNITVNGTANATIVFDVTDLAPGRYAGTIIVTKFSNATENATVAATVDVPITLVNGVGYFSGNITNTSIEYYYFNASSVAGAAGVNVTIRERTGDENFTIWLYDNTTTFQPPSQQTAAGASLLWNVSSGHSYPMGGVWYVAVSNGTTNTSIHFNATLQILQNSLRVNSSFASGMAPINENRAYNKTVTYLFYIENNADYAITLENVTGNGPYLNNSAYYMEWAHNLTNGTTVAGGSTVTGHINVTIDTSKTNNTLGTYSGWLFLNTTNGYPRNTYNLSIAAVLSSSLTVTIPDVTNDTQANTTTIPGAWVNLTVAPKYQSGDIVTGLVGDNFTATISHVYGDTIGPCTVSLLNETKVSDPGSAYLIKAYVPPTSTCGSPNAMLGGNYSVSVSTTDLTGSNTGSGTWAGNLTVYDSAVYIKAWDTNAGAEVASLDKLTSSTLVMTPKLYNFGPKDATGVFVNHTVSGACSRTIGGSSIYLGTVPGWTIGGMVNATPSTWTFTMSSSPGTCTINLTGYATTGTWALWSRNVVINVINTSSGGTTGGDQQTGGTNTSSGSTLDLTITNWPKSLSIVQGESKTADLMVKNSGSKTIYNMITKAEGVDESWAKGSAISSIEPGQSYNLPVSFSIPANAGVKNYPIVYVASSSNATARASADLAVLPNENTKKTINETLTNLTWQYGAMAKKLEELAAKGTNVTAVNATLNEAKTLIEQANGYAATGDWFSVNSMLPQIQSALNNAETKMNALTGTSVIGGPSDIPTYLMAGAGIALMTAGAAAIWMIKTGRKLPTLKVPLGKGGPGASFSARKAGKGKFSDAFGRIKEKLGSVRTKKKSTSHYSYHYQPG
ncbi:MAG: hypothetical protein QXD77_01025 [Candidatus Aenigmatarchaeota archaeon]